MGNNRKYDLEDRLIEFAVRIVKLVEMLPDTRAYKYIASQLIRSGMSPALNYGEALSAESKKDFIHKLKIVLKELRETKVSLILIKKTTLEKSIEDIDLIFNECT